MRSSAAAQLFTTVAASASQSRASAALDINAAPPAFAFRKIVFEIRIRCPDFIQCVHRFARKRGASEICVNDNSSSVDD